MDGEHWFRPTSDSPVEDVEGAFWSQPIDTDLFRTILATDGLLADHPTIHPQSPPLWHSTDDHEQPRFVPGLSSSPDSGKEDVNKMQKRLARKAQLARESRRRKKLYVEDLENQVKKLETRIEELETKHARAAEKRRKMVYARTETERKRNQHQLLSKLQAAVDSEKWDPETYHQVGVMIKLFVDNSRERQTQADYNLDRVEDCLSPTSPVKFVMWGLDQQDDFYDNPGLWNSLVQQELGLSIEQQQRLLSYRKRVHGHRQDLNKADDRLIQLRERAENHLEAMGKECDELLGILDPLQIAKFFIWVESNQWGLKMLDGMFAKSTLP